MSWCMKSFYSPPCWLVTYAFACHTVPKRACLQAYNGERICLAGMQPGNDMWVEWIVDYCPCWFFSRRSIVLPSTTNTSILYSDIFYFLASCKKQRKSGTSACSQPLSAPTIKLLILTFLHFRVQYDFFTYLAKFQSITNIRSNFIWTFIFENLRPLLLDLVSRLGCELEKITSNTKKYLTCWNYNNKYRKSHEEHVQSFYCSLGAPYTYSPLCPSSTYKTTCSWTQKCFSPFKLSVN